MATLKDHQQAMVDLLASGSGTPASASRLAHAMHDVLSHMISGGLIMNQNTVLIREINDTTTPGLNDKALAGDIEACRIKLTGAGCWPKATPAERRVKELENTIRQLKVRNAELKDSRDAYKAQAENFRAKLLTERAGCRKDDTQVCEHYETVWEHVLGELHETKRCCTCGAPVEKREVRS